VVFVHPVIYYIKFVLKKSIQCSVGQKSTPKDIDKLCKTAIPNICQSFDKGMTALNVTAPYMEKWHFHYLLSLKRSQKLLEYPTMQTSRLGWGI